MSFFDFFKKPRPTVENKNFVYAEAVIDNVKEQMVSNAPVEYSC